MTAAHPAVFSDPILPHMADMLDDVRTVLDPFAGTGKIHLLDQYETTGVEIEPEWATMHPRTIVASALSMPFIDDAFDATATSPCYGNRMADAHNAQEKCKPCGGTGRAPTPSTFSDACDKCGGAGRRSYKRITYTHYLGRKLHPENAGAMQWGRKYRAFHADAWREVTRVTRKRLVLNISDHIRDKKVQEVTAWHIDCLTALGWVLQGKVDVDTSRMGYGQNRDARVPFEHVLRFEKAA